MEYIGLSEFAEEVHQNAVEHGWWEGERCLEEIHALIHSEWSEALEEYRAGRPMVWHKCPYNGGMCEKQEVHQGDFDCSKCTADKRKPEGIAVELIDGCIRILDLLVARPFKIDEDYVREGMQMYEGENEKLPVFINALHDRVSNPEESVSESLSKAVGHVFQYLRNEGIDPVKVMLEKHEYNKTRPYKHGGKVC